jgi:hypothetical protein
MPQIRKAMPQMPVFWSSAALLLRICGICVSCPDAVVPIALELA